MCVVQTKHGCGSGSTRKDGQRVVYTHHILTLVIPEVYFVLDLIVHYSNFTLMNMLLDHRGCMGASGMESRR